MNQLLKGRNDASLPIAPAPKPQIAHAYYPVCKFHPDGRIAVAKNETQEEALRESGYLDTPQEPVTETPAAAAPSAEIAVYLKTITDLESELAQVKDELEQVTAAHAAVQEANLSLLDQITKAKKANKAAKATSAPEVKPEA